MSNSIVRKGNFTSYFDPRTISSCQLWFDGEDVNGNGSSVTNGASVFAWIDKSGNGRNATASSAGTYNSSAKAVVFNNNFYTTPYLANPTNETGFYVFLTTSSGGPQMILGANTGGREIAIYNNGNQFGIINSLRAWGALTPGGTITANTLYFATSQISSGTSTSISLNGALTFVGPTTVPAFTAGVLTSLGREAGTSFPFIGRMHEIILYDTVLSTANRQQIEGYLAWKWGLQSNLPTSHPYFRNPPAPSDLLIPSLPNLTKNTLIFNPRSLTGCQLWLDAADVNGNGNLPLTNTSISSWVDKTGNARNFTQNTGGSQPTFLTNILNNRPILRFSNQFLSNAGYSLFANASSGLAIFIVFRTTNVNAQTGIFTQMWNGTTNYTETELGFSYATGAGYSLANIGSVGFHRGNGAVTETAPSTLATNTFYIMSAMCANSGSTPSSIGIFLNGVSTAASDFGTGFLNTSGFYSPGSYPVFPTSAVYVGARNDRGPINNFFPGDIAEIIHYNSSLSGSQREQVEGYLAWKWGLTSSLPSSHPFKNSPLGIPSPSLTLPQRIRNVS